MFERFTDESRKAMGLANQIAKHYSQEYIGRETVFLALTNPDTELYKKLKEHGYDIDNIRRLVEESFHFCRLFNRFLLIII